jgi:hypothetical protein
LTQVSYPQVHIRQWIVRRRVDLRPGRLLSLTSALLLLLLLPATLRRLLVGCFALLSLLLILLHFEFGWLDEIRCAAANALHGAVALLRLATGGGACVAAGALRNPTAGLLLRLLRLLLCLLLLGLLGLLLLRALLLLYGLVLLRLTQAFIASGGAPLCIVGFRWLRLLRFPILVPQVSPCDQKQT